MRHLTSLLAVLFVFAGCGPSAASFCSDSCDCVGCSDAEFDRCVDDYEDAQKFAADRGCDEQADEYASCVNSEFECIEGQIDADGCNAEFEALGRCLL
jgi:hypothetical protein